MSSSCVNSGEASIPKPDLSSTTDTAGEVTLSSTELSVDPVRAFLEGKSVVVTSPLVESTGALGSQRVRRPCSAKRRIARDTPVRRIEQGRRGRSVVLQRERSLTREKVCVCFTCAVRCTVHISSSPGATACRSAICSSFLGSIGTSPAHRSLALSRRLRLCLHSSLLFQSRSCK